MIRVLLISLLLVGCANSMMWNVGTETNPRWTSDQEEAINFFTRQTCSGKFPDAWTNEEQREYFMKTLSYDECYEAWLPEWTRYIHTRANQADERKYNASEKDQEESSNLEKFNCIHLKSRYETEKKKVRARLAEANTYMRRANSTRDQYAKNNLIRKSNKARSQARYADNKARDYKVKHNYKGCEPRIY